MEGFYERRGGLSKTPFAGIAVALDREDVALDEVVDAVRQIDELAPGAQHLDAVAVGDAKDVAHAHAHADRAEVRQGEAAVVELHAGAELDILRWDHHRHASGADVEHAGFNVEGFGVGAFDGDGADQGVGDRRHQAVVLASLQAQQALGHAGTEGVAALVGDLLDVIEGKLDLDAVELGGAHQLVGSGDAAVDVVFLAGVENDPGVAVGGGQQGGEEGLVACGQIGGDQRAAFDQCAHDLGDLARTLQHVLRKIVRTQQVNTGVVFGAHAVLGAGASGWTVSVRFYPIAGRALARMWKIAGRRQGAPPPGSGRLSSGGGGASMSPCSTRYSQASNSATAT